MPSLKLIGMFAAIVALGMALLYAQRSGLAQGRAEGEARYNALIAQHATTVADAVADARKIERDELAKRAAAELELLTRNSLAASLCLCLTACGANPSLPDPVVREVERVRYVPVPASLTALCEVDPVQRTVGEALERVPRLEACLDDLNGRMNDIRALPATPPI
jgi:hypothetical protein